MSAKIDSRWSRTRPIPCRLRSVLQMKTNSHICIRYGAWGDFHDDFPSLDILAVKIPYENIQRQSAIDVHCARSIWETNQAALVQWESELRAEQCTSADGSDTPLSGGHKWKIRIFGIRTAIPRDNWGASKCLWERAKRGMFKNRWGKMDFGWTTYHTHFFVSRFRRLRARKQAEAGRLCPNESEQV